MLLRSGLGGAAPAFPTVRQPDPRPAARDDDDVVSDVSRSSRGSSAAHGEGGSHSGAGFSWSPDVVCAAISSPLVFVALCRSVDSPTLPEKSVTVRSVVSRGK